PPHDAAHPALRPFPTRRSSDLNDPDVLLSDEATSALDPETTHNILALLRDINQKTGVTVVMITHQMEVVREICDRVAVLSHGQRSEEHTSELQSRENLVCRLLL